MELARHIRIVVGFSAGSASDQVARTIAPALSAALRREIEIVLRPGNNGADAACEVAGSAPDGATLFVATLGTHALAAHLDARLPYDPLRDFVPISLLTKSPLVLGVHAALGIRSVHALVERALAQPGGLTYGTSAIGGAPHLAAELFQALTGVEMRHVRYGHTERLYDDLADGSLALSFNNMMSMLPRCLDGTIRALAVTTASRSRAADELPTLVECGVDGYEMSNWLALLAPRGTAQAAIQETREAIVQALADDAVGTALRRGGVDPIGSTSDELAQFMAAELARWRPVVARFRDTAPSPPP
jgi:tripartite-type tricarboxylate transporter receptor subunit TctC